MYFSSDSVMGQQYRAACLAGAVRADGRIVARYEDTPAFVDTPLRRAMVVGHTGEMSGEPVLDPEVLAYYDQGRERSRLETTSRLEYLRTQELLVRFLPVPPARVLDVGGGAGAYAVPLIQSGYDVVLVDPVPLHVDQARESGVSSAVIGDARSLEFDDDSFDAVLMLGPLYHLTEREDRVLALREAARVARPAGVVVVAVISRFASTLDGFNAGFLLDDRFERIVETDIATGRHDNVDGVPGWFTTAYFHRPDELDAEFVEAGCQVVEVLAIEGPTSAMPDLAAWLEDDERRAVLLRAIGRVESEPSLLGSSSHILVVARP
jgi:ubiquinone/menaquinone biosynthesis C-methylase UbiE